MQELLPGYLMREISLGDVPLYEVTNGANKITLVIGLTQNTFCDKEGEWSLRLLVDGETVFLLSFSLVPGWVVGSESKELLLISRLQGIPGAYQKIRTATKALSDIAPAALLLAAMQGVALALGVDEFASVSAADQSSFDGKSAARFTTAYDDFFAELGVEKNSAGFFWTLIPLPDKPMTAVKRGHKIRTKQKRKFKRELMRSCFEFFSKRMMRAAELPTWEALAGAEEMVSEEVS